MFRILIIFIFISSCSELNQKDSNKLIKKEISQTQNNEYSLYIIGDPYYINDTQYIPEEDYDYSEIGLASIYDIKSHGKKTSNNEEINITKLIAGHKTLPLPSVVRITNLENDLKAIDGVDSVLSLIDAPIFFQPKVFILGEQMVSNFCQKIRKQCKL